MFTGVVKLAQIDDYIAPSQNCIQPKIMKNDDKKQKATVTLNDCLACSGCITSAESILIEQMSIKKFLQYTTQNEEIIILISPQSLLSFSHYFQTSPQNFLTSFSQFLLHNFPHSIKNIYDLSVGIELCHQAIFEQFNNRLEEKNFPTICSECPGWVCYAQKTLSEDVIRYMSKVKSPQQIMGQLIKQKYGNKCKIVSIMPCFDKKLQAIRFDIENGIKQIDLTLATTQVIDLINQYIPINKEQKQSNFILSSTNNEQYKFANIFTDKNNSQINFLTDQTSNGYIQFLLNKLNVKEYTVKQIRNSDFIQYSFQINGQVLKMAKCYGFRNIQKAVQGIKRKKCLYVYIEMMACPGGCFSGGGQIRYEGIKNKEVVVAMKEIQKYCKSSEEVQKEDVSLAEKKIDVAVEYRAIEKTLTAEVMNW